MVAVNGVELVIVIDSVGVLVTTIVGVMLGYDVTVIVSETMTEVEVGVFSIGTVNGSVVGVEDIAGLIGKVG